VTDALALAVAKLSLVAAASPSPGFSPNVVSPRATDDSVVRPGWLGFIVFLAMAGAVYLLLRSLVRHLKRVNFDEGGDPADVPSVVPTVEPEPGASSAAAVDHLGGGGDGQS
jgi:hypothetical protein